VEAGATSPGRLDVVAVGRGGLCESTEDADGGPEKRQRDASDAIDLTVHASTSPPATAAVCLSVCLSVSTVVD